MDIKFIDRFFTAHDSVATSLLSLREDGIEAVRKSDEFLKKHSLIKPPFCTPSESIWGGLSFIESGNGDTVSADSVYGIIASGRLAKEIRELPMVTYDDFWKVISINGGKANFFRVHFRDNKIALLVTERSDNPFVPVAGLSEINIHEFLDIKNEKNAR